MFPAAALARSPPLFLLSPPFGAFGLELRLERRRMLFGSGDGDEFDGSRRAGGRDACDEHYDAAAAADERRSWNSAETAFLNGNLQGYFGAAKKRKRKRKRARAIQPTAAGRTRRVETRRNEISCDAMRADEGQASA